MVKSKQKRTGKAHGEENGASYGLIDSPNRDSQHVDDDWIIVKKQRVTIWVPPAPLCGRSLTKYQGPNDNQLLPPKMAGNPVQLPLESSAAVHPSGNEHDKTNATSLAVEKETRAVRKAPPPLPKSTLTNPSGNEHDKANTTSLAVQKETRAVRRAPPPSPKSTLANPSGNEHEKANAISLAVQKETCAVRRAPPPLPKSTLANPSGNEHENPTSLAVQKETPAARRSPPPSHKPTIANPETVDHRIESETPHQVSILRQHKMHGVSSVSKVIKQPRRLLAPRRSSNMVTLNQGLRASNLQRKLERAGGLSKWLTSLGLGQFEKIFQGKNLSKYQLVNLTMKKLKDMGASAVGPRRKLIHAMDCVCQPYCFEVL